MARVSLLANGLDLHRVFGRVVHNGAALVENLIEAAPDEHEEDDVLPALDDGSAAVDGFEVAAAEAEGGLEDVAVAAAELEAGAVGELAAFAEEPFLDRVGREDLAAAAEGLQQAHDPRAQQQQ